MVTGDTVEWLCGNGEIRRGRVVRVTPRHVFAEGGHDGGMTGDRWHDDGLLAEYVVPLSAVIGVVVNVVRFVPLDKLLRAERGGRIRSR